MFITKKKFNEALEAARAETAEKIYQSERICRIEDDFGRRMRRLEERVRKLENPGEKDKPDNGKTAVPEY